MDVEDADAALTWEALESVGSDSDAHGSAHVLPSHEGSGGAARGVDHGALDDADAFASLDELRAFAAPGGRSKRKNFSKHLQLLCLERYAAHARAHGRLPDRSACELLLLESFAQFVREGGSDAHPRLAHAEFLKLVRNRSAERQRRLRDQPSGEPGSHEGRRGKKRKRADAYDAKIDALIEEIDRARRSPSAEAQADGSEDSTATADDILDNILRIQQETQLLQREMSERLARLQHQCDQHEPSSASV